MTIKQAFLAVPLLVAVLLGGCDPGPTGPEGPDTFTLHTTMSNVSGAATILDAQILVDNFVEAESCPAGELTPDVDADGNIVGYTCNAPAVSSAAFDVGGNIGPGSHRLEFFMSSQTTGGTDTRYNVMAFDVVIYDRGGKVLKTISLPSQSARLGGGQRSIVYSFSF